MSSTSWPRNLKLDPLWTAAAMAAWVSILMAPQWPYLRHQAPGSRVLATILVFALASTFAVLWSRMLTRTCGASLRSPSTTAVIVTTHFSTIALWLAPAAGSGDVASSWRTWTFIIVNVVVISTILITRKRPHRHYESIIVLSLAVTAFAFSSIALRVAPSGVVAQWSWGLYVLAALIGWGTITNRLLAPNGMADWGQRAAWGLAAVLAIGGVLNLTWTISRWTVLALLAAGIGGLAVHVRRDPIHLDRDPGWRRPTTVVILVLVVALALLQFAAAPAGTVDTVFAHPAFDAHDDLQAYLVFPHKMLQLGSMGSEPFEARRMLSLGGQSFLQTLSLVMFSTSSAHLVEMGILPLVLLGLIIGSGRRQGLDPRLTLLVAVIAISYPHLAMRGNTSALLGGVVLLLSLFRHLGEAPSTEAGQSIGRIALVALTAAGLIALKSTFLPAVATVMAVAWISAFATSRRRSTVLIEATACLICIVLLSLPWMVSILQSSGTLLYPIFGKGFYGGLYTDGFATVTEAVAVPLVDVARTLLQHLAKLLPIVVLVLFASDHRRHRPALALAAAAAVTVLLLVIMGDPEINRGLTRYAFPVSMAASIALLLACFRPAHHGTGTAGLAPTAGIAMAVMLLLGNQAVVLKNYDQVLTNLATAIAGRETETNLDRARTNGIQAVLPRQGRTLAAVERPYLFDFRHHDISTLSLPGMSSPPPGLPIDKGAEAVASYLLERGITNLVYGAIDDPARLLDLSEQDIRNRYPRSKMRWVMLRYQQRFHRVVQALSVSRRLLYNDGTTVVIDLETSSTRMTIADQEHRVAGMVDSLWTGPEVRINDLDRGADGQVLALWTRGWRPDSSTKVTAMVGDQVLDQLPHAGGGLLYRLPTTTPRLFDLLIRSDLTDPVIYGADPGTVPVGLDLESIEILPFEAGAAPPASLQQPVEHELDPSAAWFATGFYHDNNWTNGNATVDRLAWPVSDSACELVLELAPVHHLGDKTSRPLVRVWVNGLELSWKRIEDDNLVFSLLEGTHEINRIRLVSPTFVPAEQGRSNDQRRLGIPVRMIHVQ